MTAIDSARIVTKAVVLAAGLGTRLAAITNFGPKELALLGDKPVLEHIVDELIGSGIKNILIVIRPGKDSIKQYFGNGSRWGVSCEYVYQKSPLGTADAVLCGKEWIGDEPFVMAWGDTIVASNFYSEKRQSAVSRLKQVFASQDCQLALLVEFLKGSLHMSLGQQRFRYLLTPALTKQRLAPLKGFQVSDIQRTAHSDQVAAGVPVSIPRWILTPGILEYLEALRCSPRKEEIRLTDALSNFVRDKHRVWAIGLQSHEHRFDIGTPEGYEAARNFVESLIIDRYERVSTDLLIEG